MINIYDLCIVLTVLTVIYILLNYFKTLHFWRSQNVQGPLPLPLIGNAISFLLKPIFEVDYANFQKYGPVYVDFFLPGIPTLNLVEPALIKQVFVNDFSNFTRRESLNWPSYVREGMAFQEGAQWRRLRSLVSPIFSASKLRKAYSKFDVAMQQAINNIQVSLASSKTEELEMRRVMKCLSLDILCRICFSAEIDSFNRPNCPMVHHMMKAFDVDKWKLGLLMLPLCIQKWLGISLMNQKSYEWFVNFLKCTIAERKQCPNKNYDDFLQMLLDSEVNQEEMKVDEVNLDSECRKQDTKPIKTKNRLNEREIIGQLIVFFFAGAESLTSLFSESLHLLAQHHEIQEKLFVDIDQTFSFTPISFDEAFNCEYLNAVMDEVQRMRSSLTRQFRTAGQDYDLDVPGFNSQNKIHIKAGQVITVSTFCLHHDPNLFDRPFEFKPERFLNKEVPDGAFMPFGIGPRTCISARFSKVLIRSVLICMIKEFRVSVTSNTHVPLRYKKMSFTMDYEEMRLRLEQRK